MNQIEKLENELLELATQDKKTWVKFYKIINQVEQEQLWKGTESRSFTQWVKSFSVKSKVHESVLWNRLKAGKVYNTYKKVQASKGIQVKPLEQVDITADNLVLLDKITRKNEEMGAALTEKVLNKELSRQDLRDTYKMLGGDERPHSKKNKEEQGEKEIPAENRVTSATITAALSNSNWLGRNKDKRKPFKSAYEQDKYRIFTEFAVYTGTSKKSRRIDVLAVENLTNNEYGIHLHGIEIKVSKSDLEGDTKYLEYTQFVDYLWLAIPESLIEVAINTKPNGVGVLVIKDKEIIVHEQADKQDMPLMREQSLTNLTIKLL